MTGFVCLGNVRKGISLEQARTFFHLPGSVTVILGLPQNYEKLPEEKRPRSMFCGVWVPADQYDENLGKVIAKPNIWSFIDRYQLVFTSILALFLTAAIFGVFGQKLEFNESLFLAILGALVGLTCWRSLRPGRGPIKKGAAINSVSLDDASSKPKETN